MWPHLGHLSGSAVPFRIYDTHLESHSRFHRASELRRTDCTAVFRTHHLIVTPFDELKSDAISTMNLQNIIEILVDCRDV